MSELSGLPSNGRVHINVCLPHGFNQVVTVYRYVGKLRVCCSNEILLALALYYVFVMEEFNKVIICFTIIFFELLSVNDTLLHALSMLS